ncbi:MAG: pitrilysin family protein [Thermoanaerobaculia bacterium]
MNPRLAGRLAATLLLLALGVGRAGAQDLAAFEARTTRHVLDNGWTFLIVERPVAPVFSFATLVDVGSAQEVPGITGLAHMFEHMAFKGTPVVGTSDYEAEAAAIDAMEAAYQAWQEERMKLEPDPEALERLEGAFREAQQEAERFVVPNEFDDILSGEGAVGMNAFTNTDQTGYFYSLPANKLELFAYMESERFLHPVFREFYKERDVVQEERRLRTESQPVGRLIEQFQATAFVAHPYKQPVVGYMSDLQSFTITDAREFYRRHYAPSNMVTAIVGDVKADEVIPLLETYFGRIPAGEEQKPLRTVEPPQIAEKIVRLEDPSQPVYVEGYHMAAVTDPDQPVWDAIDDVLSGGRTSRLYRSLVRDRRIAASVGSFSQFPGSKYPTLWIAYAFPTPESSNEEVQAGIRDEIARIREEPVGAEELERFKTRAKAGLLRSLRDNQGLAFTLAQYETWFGDWRELFRYLERIEEVTPEDIQRVADATLIPTNRTVGMIVTEGPGDASPEGR